MKADKLYLVGFMGAGKTTVARALGKRTGWRVEDIDERIEAREHRSVASIFSQQGEPYFRQLERWHSASCCRFGTWSWLRAAARSSRRTTAR